jgi:5'-phosphate synthase pdxT subunit
VTVRIGVLALQGDVREHVAALGRIGAEPVLVRSQADLETVAALIVPGGESTTIGKLADRYGLIEPLRDRIRAGMPVLGTCAGMIFLARGTTSAQPQHQLGVLDVIVERNAFGRQVDSFEAPVDVKGFDEPLWGVFIRAPRVAEVGPGVDVLAEIDGRPVMVRSGAIVATSFHPELTGDDRLHTLIFQIAGES